MFSNQVQKGTASTEGKLANSEQQANPLEWGVRKVESGAAALAEWGQEKLKSLREHLNNPTRGMAAGEREDYQAALERPSPPSKEELQSQVKNPDFRKVLAENRRGYAEQESAEAKLAREFEARNGISLSDYKRTNAVAEQLGTLNGKDQVDFIKNSHVEFGISHHYYEDMHRKIPGENIKMIQAAMSNPNTDWSAIRDHIDAENKARLDVHYNVTGAVRELQRLSSITRDYPARHSLEGTFDFREELKGNAQVQSLPDIQPYVTFPRNLTVKGEQILDLIPGESHQMNINGRSFACKKIVNEQSNVTMYFGSEEMMGEICKTGRSNSASEDIKAAAFCRFNPKTGDSIIVVALPENPPAAGAGIKLESAQVHELAHAIGHGEFMARVLQKRHEQERGSGRTDYNALDMFTEVIDYYNKDAKVQAAQELFAFLGKKQGARLDFIKTIFVACSTEAAGIIKDVIGDLTIDEKTYMLNYMGTPERYNKLFGEVFGQVSVDEAGGNPAASETADPSLAETRQPRRQKM